MPRKKDCFGKTYEEYICKTPNCPYLEGCLRVIDKSNIEEISKESWRLSSSSIVLEGRVYYNDKDGILRSRELN